VDNYYTKVLKNRFADMNRSAMWINKAESQRLKAKG
jgi:hypothetical protein